ncbi:dethiobiotin synthase [Sulfurimonas sp.]|uniref:dethiobiotin synthase n=1 Tax=Sulfurimonas sp. TaxID=2022749 RepID=UPI0026203863|nr:dethiobiotin synthase [Sulfurimonas sp.]
MVKRIFITATNTDIGKTYTTIKMLREYASKGLRVGAIKLVETGVVSGVYPDGDLLLSTLKELNAECLDLEITDVVPLSYELPAAPYIASGAAMLDFDTLTSAIEKMEERCDVLLLEGAGGLLVPLDYSFMMIDLIGFFNASALLVTHCSLGCINDTLLSLQALEQKNINSVLAFNCRDNDENFAKVSEPYFIKKQQEVLKVDKDIDTICDVLYNL